MENTFNRAGEEHEEKNRTQISSDILRFRASFRVARIYLYLPTSF
jgi:hypothetical protein